MCTDYIHNILHTDSYHVMMAEYKQETNLNLSILKKLGWTVSSSFGMADRHAGWGLEIVCTCSSETPSHCCPLALHCCHPTLSNTTSVNQYTTNDYNVVNLCLFYDRDEATTLIGWIWGDHHAECRHSPSAWWSYRHDDRHVYSPY